MSYRLVMLMVLLVVLPPLAGSVTADEAVRLRVLTYNIHHGEGTDGRFDLPRLAKVITDAQPDLVALQEVDNKTRRAGGVDQAAKLGELTGLHARFGKAMDYDGGQYGEAILSRLPIVATVNHPLPHDAGREPRAALAVQVQLPESEQRIWFVGTHLDHLRDNSSRLAQAKEIRRLFAPADAAEALPNILAGDLNAEPQTAEIKHLTEVWQVATDHDGNNATYPAEDPKVRIDYVMAWPADGWRVVSCEVLDEKVASDHRPLLVVWEWIGE